MANFWLFMLLVLFFLMIVFLDAVNIKSKKFKGTLSVLSVNSSLNVCHLKLRWNLTSGVFNMLQVLV